VDVTDESSVERTFEAINPEIVANFAAYTDVDACERNRRLALQLNAEAPKSLATVCARYDAFLIHISTDYVFDGREGDYVESSEPNPINYYGETKLKGEKAIQRSGCRHCIVRTSTPYGVHPVRKCFPYILYEALRQGRPQVVASDQITSPTAIPNLCYLILETMRLRHEGILHLAGGSAASRLDVAMSLAKAFSFDESLIVPMKIEDLGWVAKRPRNSSLSVNKARSILVTKPLDFRQGIIEFAEELRGFLQG